MIHPAPPEDMPQRALQAAAAALILLVPSLLSIGPASAETWKANVPVLIFIDDSNYRWDDAEVEPNSTALCATLVACKDMEISINYSMSQYGAFVTEIGGLNAPTDFSWWWYLLVWNMVNSTWEEAPKGASDLKVDDGDFICWCPNHSAPPMPNPLTKYPWPKFRADHGNTGTAMSDAPRHIAILWETNLSNGPVDASPAVADGKVFISTGGVYDWSTMSYKTPPHLYALNSGNGSVLWSQETTAAGWQVSSPAVRNGRVYIGTSDGKVMTFHEDDGDSLWTFKTGASATGVTASPAVGSDAVYIPAGDGKLYALSVGGSELWNFSLDGPVYMSSPAMYDGSVYFGTDNGTLWCIRQNGTLVWNFSAMGKIRTSPAIYQNMVYFISTGYDGWTSNYSFIYVLNATDGRQLWRADLSPSTSSPAIVEGRILVATNTQVLSLDMDGNNVWTYFTKGPVQASPVISGKRLYFAENMENGTLNCCQWNSPEKVGSTVRPPAIDCSFAPKPFQYLMCSPAVADKRVFIGSDNGKVYCLGASEGLPAVEVDPCLAVKFSKTRVKEGETVKLSFSIRNINDYKLWNVEAQLLVDDSPLGDKVLLGCLDAGERSVVTFNWTASAGAHDIEFLVNDPGRMIHGQTAYVPVQSASTESGLAKYLNVLCALPIILVIVTIAIAFLILRKPTIKKGGGNEQK